MLPNTGTSSLPSTFRKGFAPHLAHRLSIDAETRALSRYTFEILYGRRQAKAAIALESTPCVSASFSTSSMVPKTARRPSPRRWISPSKPRPWAMTNSGFPSIISTVSASRARSCRCWLIWRREPPKSASARRRFFCRCMTRSGSPRISRRSTFSRAGGSILASRGAGLFRFNTGISTWRRKRPPSRPARAWSFSCACWLRKTSVSTAAGTRAKG